MATLAQMVSTAARRAEQIEPDRDGDASCPLHEAAALLLGHALTGAAYYQPYPALLNDRVLQPLALRDTTCSTSAPEGHTQATGHWHGRSRPPFRIPGLPAAGGLRSSARDLLTVVESLIDPVSAGVSPVLQTALRDVLRPRLRLPNGNKLALVWNIRPRRDGSHLYHHSGATRGCTAFAGFDVHHGTALVALANTAPCPDNTLIQDAYTSLIALRQSNRA